MVSVTDLENHKTKFIYDSEHRLIKVINASNEVITRNVYDEMGRLIYIYDAETEEVNSNSKLSIQKKSLH